uniref:Uncharacterized protein n=1 Tax=Prymnesium polylepis TaxID=72548 RepID=A0A6T7ZFE0_9EUKA|mmetsp:Transcript_26452/g.65572  ORF Transcript_26452/g.65572 Transcript_26452/m.65572 type:complete len:136 (+) Transcript_26452:62-469(+)|eukprot:6262697-Prymnesium_polylepis.1
MSTPEIKLRNRVRAGDVGGVKGMLKAGEVDYTAPGETLRGFTPLHLACWGSLKPENDKDIVEALLITAQKAGAAQEQALRDAADFIDGLKPVDLAKERRDTLSQRNPQAKEEDLMEEKRRFDKVIEYLEKGLPAT